ncbi:type IV secretion system protein [Ensifer sp. NM-2]|uniref:type IV secretion system protein n=1 Tax=Ensifer sp. NM-2 TaxID=2109730 RepID=UPI001304FB86|nr:type IV secretion system protein [Ensifer sp. NM-2]
MGLIVDVMTHIDDKVIAFTEEVFTAVAVPMRSLLQGMGLVGLLFIAVNTLMQFRPISMSEYMKWALRFALIYSFATIWVNFKLIYDALISLPNDYVSVVMDYFRTKITTHRTDILDPGRIYDLYSAMDEFAHALRWIAYDFIRDIALSNLGLTLRNLLTGLVILIIGGLFTAISAIIVAFSKIGFAVAVGMAPLAIVFLMMDQTKQYFETWARLAVSFICIPLITGMLMALVFFIASDMLTQSNAGSENKAAYFYFIFMMVAALIMLSQVPTMASTLAGASVAAVGASLASAQGMMNNANRIRRVGRHAKSAGQRVRDGAGVAREAMSNGASPGGIAWAAISGMRQSAMTRQTRRDERMAGRMHGAGDRGNRAFARYGQPPAENATVDKSSNNKPQEETNEKKSKTAEETSSETGAQTEANAANTAEKTATEQKRASQLFKETASGKGESGSESTHQSVGSGTRSGSYEGASASKARADKRASSRSTAEKRASSPPPSGNYGAPANPNEWPEDDEDDEE